MQRQNRPPAFELSSTNRGVIERPPLGMQITELVIDPLPTPDRSVTGSEDEVFSIGKQTNASDQPFPTYSGLPHSPRDTIARESSQDILHDIMSSTVPRGNVYIAGLPGNPSRRSPNHSVYVRSGRWSPVRGHVESFMPDPLPSRPVSPNKDLPSKIHQPSQSAIEARRKSRVLIMEDGRVFLEKTAQEYDIKSSRPNTASTEGSASNEMSTLLENPPDPLILNERLYAYSPKSDKYKQYGRVQSTTRSVASDTSSLPGGKSFNSYPLSSRPSSSRLSRQYSFNKGDEGRFYRSRHGTGSTQSLAEVLADAQAESPVERHNLGLKIDTSGKNYSNLNRDSVASYTSTTPSFSNTPTGEGYSPSSPVRRMYSSASGLIGSIDTLPEDNESEPDQDQEPHTTNPSSAGSGVSVGLGTADASPVTTKKEAFHRFWWHKVKSQFRSTKSSSKRQRSGTPSPAISPITGQPLSHAEYGYNQTYVQVPFVPAEQLTRMSDMEKKELRSRSTLSIRSQASFSGNVEHDPTSFRSRMHGQATRVAFDDEGRGDVQTPTLAPSRSTTTLSRRGSFASDVLFG